LLFTFLENFFTKFLESFDVLIFNSIFIQTGRRRDYCVRALLLPVLYLPVWGNALQASERFHLSDRHTRSVAPSSDCLSNVKQRALVRPGFVYSADACNVAGVSCNVGRVSCNITGNTCNITGNTCMITGNTCNITRNTCKITRVRCPRPPNTQSQRPCHISVPGEVCLMWRNDFSTL